MIEVRSISKFYGHKRAVDSLSFSIREGEIVGLLGLNGAGKSTILKMLGSFLMPSKGEALIGGHSVITDPDAVRRLIGYQPDVPPLYNEMRTRSYLEFVARLKNVPKAQVKTQVQDVLEKTNLIEVQEMRLDQLSHGFRQRVGIAQALVHRPKVVILDEPINGLDPVQIIGMRDLILSLREKHTVILSSHILSEITKTCDRILVINRGKLVAEGTEEDLQTNARVGLDILVELETYHAGILDALRQLPGVLEVSDDQIENYRIRLQCSQDIRAVVAKTVIDHGGRLISLQKEEAALETLFLKLVRKGGAE